MRQIITALMILHKKFKVFHGDIKTDNILIKGINDRDKFICNKYLDELNKLSPENKLLRSQYHKNITQIILDELKTTNIFEKLIFKNKPQIDILLELKKKILLIINENIYTKH